MTETLLASLVVFAAYFLKGFSGFGPALVMIPFFTLIYDPGTAIVTSTIFDFLAGLLLFFSVIKQIQWKFVLSVFAALAFGAIFGSFLLGKIPVDLIKKIIGVTIIVFAIIIFFQKEGNHKIKISKKLDVLKYPIATFGGFLGGFIGISGPPIIIYLKMLYEKSFFRTQLIGIFLLGAGWRSILYRINNITYNLSYYEFGIFLIIMILAAWAGSKLHLKVNEVVFNRVIAMILAVPALNLIFGN